MNDLHAETIAKIKEQAAIVETWPDWKKNILVHSSMPMFNRGINTEATMNTKTAEIISRFPIPEYQRMSDGERTDVTRQMLADLERLAKQDGCIAAGWALSLVNAMADDTLLKDLTDEQWRELGFEWMQDYVPQNVSYWSYRREHWIIYIPDAAKLCMPGYAVIEDFTLGQLRHLLAALGGEE